MSVTSRSPQTTPKPATAATQLAEASLVRILTRQDGDALAAGGILAQALTDRGTAFHLAPTRSRANRARRIGRGDDAAVTVAVGDVEQADITLSGTNTTAAAVEIAHALEVDPPQGLTFAGILAGDNSLDSVSLSVPPQQTDRLGIPTTDPVTGLAHSLWIHGPFSGAPERVADLFAELELAPDELQGADEETLTRLRSVFAVEAARDQAVGRTESLQRLLSPHACPGPFPTLEGFADVLGVVAAEAPGVGTGLVVGSDVVDPAIQVWAEHAKAAHRCLHTADAERYSGLFAVPVDAGPVQTIAATAARVCSNEPVTVAVGETQTAVVGHEQSIRAVTAAITDATGGVSDGTKHRGVIRYDDSPDYTRLIDRARDAL